MKPSRLISVLTLSLFVVLPGLAQDTADAPPPAAEERPAPPPSDAEQPRTLEEIFIPSEEIAADEEVTFPIDI